MNWSFDVDGVDDGNATAGDKYLANGTPWKIGTIDVLDALDLLSKLS